MTTEYDGLNVVASDDQSVGTVARTYLDGDEQPRMVAVKSGTVLSSYHMVPADEANVEDDGLHVAWTRNQIEESPPIDAPDVLEGETLDQVRAYYRQANQQRLDTEQITEIGQTDQRHRPANDFEMTDGGPVSTEIRDLGDVIEIPIVEEVLVKRPVVREVLRVRKSQLTETQNVGSDLQRETVKVVSGEDLVVENQVEDEE